MHIGDFHRKQYEGDMKWVTRVAHEMKKDNPGVLWDECIRQAEQVLKERDK